MKKSTESRKSKAQVVATSNQFKVSEDNKKSSERNMNNSYILTISEIDLPISPKFPSTKSNKDKSFEIRPV